MSSHDALCPQVTTGGIEWCQCQLIQRVREDDMEAALTAIKVAKQHGFDLGYGKGYTTGIKDGRLAAFDLDWEVKLLHLAEDTHKDLKDGEL